MHPLVLISSLSLFYFLLAALSLSLTVEFALTLMCSITLSLLPVIRGAVGAVTNNGVHHLSTDDVTHRESERESHSHNMLCFVLLLSRKKVAVLLQPCEDFQLERVSNSLDGGGGDGEGYGC